MKKKLLLTAAVVMSAVLLITGSIVGTIAYLRSTAYVTNVFTYGTVAVTIDETTIAADGINPAVPAARTDIGNKYKLMPGTTYVKDPIIHVGTSSENTYLFLRVENGLSNIEVKTDDTENDTIEEQLIKNGWIKMDSTWNPGTTYGTGSNIYYYAGTKTDDAATTAVDESKTNVVPKQTDVTTFTTFTLQGDGLKEEDLIAASSKSVVVVVYAVQAQGFKDAVEAAGVFVNDFANPILSTGNN